MQQSSPSFPTTGAHHITSHSSTDTTLCDSGGNVANVSAEEAAPPIPSCSVTHYENGGPPEIMVSPPPQEKPRRNEARTMESLLDELEGTVPSPRYGHRDANTKTVATIR